MSKTALIQNVPDVDELNDIQAQWMAVDPTGPQHEINRVCKLMERYPRIYVSGHDGNGVCIVYGSPTSMTVSFSQALETCQALGWTHRCCLEWHDRTVVLDLTVNPTPKTP